MKQQSNTISFVQKHIQQKHQPKPKQYCCLYHYLQGKKTKGLTPCNNHVRLGVINPITALNPKERELIKMSRINHYKELIMNGNKGKDLQVNADQYDLNFHTHFINEIQKRGSMSRQLIKPRVYVEKVYQRNQFEKRQNFLYPKTQNQSSFKQIYNFYRRFAQKTQFKNSQQLRDDIISFSRQNNIKTANLSSQATINIDKSTACQYLFSKQDFKTYLLTHGFSQRQSQEFWSIAYNKDRFTILQKSASNLAILKNEFVSMKAFVYNFEKFYLDQQEYYRNVFSQPALRQRLIYLRLTLQPWFNKNIILKSKLKKWKATQLEIAEYLKTSGYQKQYEDLIKFIQERNRLYFMMRTLSKSVYDLTDQKNIGLDVWNNRITYLIQEKSDSLICFMEFVEKFKQHQVERQLESVQSNQDHKKFKITELLEFLHQNRDCYQELQQKWIIKWIRNIYKYLYYYKNIEQLQIDPKTLQLSCKAQIQVQNQLISQFIHYKTNQTDNFLQVLTKLTQQIEQKLESMPQLQGHKKYLVQCNYLTETLLRIIRKNNFAYFQILSQINRIAEDHWFDFQGCIQEIVAYIRQNKDNTKKFDVSDKFWKQYFTFKLEMSSELNKTLTQQNKEAYTYKDAYDKYQNVKEALGISKKYANNESQANPLKVTKVQKPKQKIPKNLPKKAQKFLTLAQQNKQDAKQKVQTFDWQMKYKRHEKQHCTNGYCIECQDIVSTEVNSTISRVEDMENYLMDLLRDV